ncbi:TIGR03086 family metal-binding protein [Luteipulveratus sp. YIM 133132]|uniref:TIGR03086 family metal-binding protein n=1 Tax=Luteipulveratus flavus TaxID=3031728 RepID=UPI0023B0673B|nr:TIGR03086 family metal-binding protein [Luteipulveratus sp. YIM 133132]MDE9367270.1 TIGR03086 family metal-binding protein [Luteipulveratus sp. YIM 133132]
MSRDLRPLHRQALQAAGERVRRVRDGDLLLATPCAGWTLADLLAHLVGQHRGFAAALRDGTAAPEAYRPVPFTQDAWASSADELTEAFAAADLDRPVLQLELHPTRPLPGSFLLGAQLLDTVVHTWDVAASLGESYVPPPAHQQVVLELAERIPDGAERRSEGAAFAPARAVPGDGWDRALGLLGRDPASVTAAG